MIDKDYSLLSLKEQFELLSLSKSAYYYQPQFDNNDFTTIKTIDQIYTKYPFYGSRKITAELKIMVNLLTEKEYKG